MGQTISIETLRAELTSRPAGQTPLLVAIDGRCAAGKTSLAQALGRDYGWSVVPLDHFFLQPHQRTPERYAAPGENVDHERFLAEVLLPLRAGRAARYRPFDCHALDFGPVISIEPTPVVILEGSYSCHPELWAHYDLRVFLTISPDEQLRRIEARNGAQGLAAFRDKWIPLEEAYFRAFDIEDRCEFRVSME